VKIIELSLTSSTRPNAIAYVTVGRANVVSITFEPCGDRKVYRVHLDNGIGFPVSEDRVSRVKYEEEETP
jgi:hypothetical protein